MIDALERHTTGRSESATGGVIDFGGVGRGPIVVDPAHYEDLAIRQQGCRVPLPRKYHTSRLTEDTGGGIVKFGRAAGEAGAVDSSGNQHFPVQ